MFVEQTESSNERENEGETDRLLPFLSRFGGRNEQQEQEGPAQLPQPVEIERPPDVPGLLEGVREHSGEHEGAHRHDVHVGQSESQLLPARALHIRPELGRSDLRDGLQRRSSEEAEVIGGIEAVPEGRDQEHVELIEVGALVDAHLQPSLGSLVPGVRGHRHARAELEMHDIHVADPVPFAVLFAEPATNAQAFSQFPQSIVAESQAHVRQIRESPPHHEAIR